MLPFDPDELKSQNPQLKHIVKDGWSMPDSEKPTCTCCKIVYPAMWLDDDSPEGMIHCTWLSSCGDPLGSIDFPLLEPLGSHQEQMFDLQILGFELAHDMGFFPSRGEKGDWYNDFC